MNAAARRYLGGRRQVDPAGRTAIVVDDGLATGATMKAALIAIRRLGAAKVVVAIPVAPSDALPDIEGEADLVVCLRSERRFRGVGGFYDDFHQLTDEETIGLLREAWSEADPGAADGPLKRDAEIPPLGLAGDLRVPPDPRGIILFAHGSGSSRLSPRNMAVADALNAKGFATLLLDLLTPDEARDRRNVFDIPLLAERVMQAALWISGEPDVADLPLGLFGASTGAGAALLAAAGLRGRVAAGVWRGGRPDLAGPMLAEVTAPTLLIVGGDDRLGHRTGTGRRSPPWPARSCSGSSRALRSLRRARRAGGGDRNGRRLVPARLPGRAASRTGARGRCAPAVGRKTARGVRTAACWTSTIRPSGRPSTVSPRPGSSCWGKSPHGTSEVDRARAAITRRLIERHGFSIVAVEADWPDAAAIDRYVRLGPYQPMRAAPFTRFPTWMWRNRDVDDFVSFLRGHNSEKPREDRVGFYGLDLYSMNASMRPCSDISTGSIPRRRRWRDRATAASHPGRASWRPMAGRRSPRVTRSVRHR